MNVDVGLTHIALCVTNLDKSIQFYAKYANMVVVHERIDKDSGSRVIWISDKTRAFVIVLFSVKEVNIVLAPFSHLGVGCISKKEVDRLCDMAKHEGVLVKEPIDSGYPAGYWAFIKDPDGHTLEVSYGQEVGLTVSS